MMSWKRSGNRGPQVIEAIFQNFNGGSQENRKMLSVGVMTPLKFERDAP